MLSSRVPAESACQKRNQAMAFGIMAWRNTVVQVLFCKLCKDQRDLYRAYLNSQEVDAIFAGNRQALAGIDILRKICNHPDLLERTKWEGSEEYGRPEKSGKLTVLMKVTCACKCHCCLLSLQTQIQGARHHAPDDC